MGSVTYDFNFGEKGMSDEVDYTITVTGDPIPSDAVITSGTFSFTIGLNGYSSSETMRLRKFYINGLKNYIGYGKAYGDSTWWDTSNRITFSGNLVILDSSPSAFTSGSFSLLLQLSYGGTFSGVNGRQGSITINYTEVTYTRCGAPKTVTVNDSSSMVTITKPEITLKWSGATSGTNNPIEGYWISYDISTNGNTWDTGYDYGTISTTSTSGSETMTFMSAGTYYRFKVLTIGSADGWDSETATVSPVVYYSTALPVVFNGTQLTSIIYNGTTISSLVYNGTKLF